MKERKAPHSVTETNELNETSDGLVPIISRVLELDEKSTRFIQCAVVAVERVIKGGRVKQKSILRLCDFLPGLPS